MRIPPYFFSDDSRSPGFSTDADVSRFTSEPDSLIEETLLEETLLEGTLKLPGVHSESPTMVSVRFGDILQPLSDAIRADRTFLSDFENDDVQLPVDLLDCLKAYQDIRRAA